VGACRVRARLADVNRALPAGAFIDGRSCVLLVRLFAPAIRAAGPSNQLDELRPALTAIAQAAEAERAAEAARLATPDASLAGWLPTAEYARLVGVSEQAIRRRISRGTIAAERRGRAWLVDPSG
jgi:hypothetical protein